MRAVSVSGTARSASSPRSPAGSSTPSTDRRRPSDTSIRTVSMAYSGTPSARVAIASAVDAGRRGASPPRSARTASRGRGSRYRAVKPRRAVPHAGRSSSSSGRASVRTKIGRSRDHSTRWSMKSSVPESAQWTSSKTSATDPLVASASKNARHAPNSSSGGTPAGIPSSCRRAASDRSRSGWPAMWASRSVAIAARVASASSAAASPARPRIISPSAQNVSPSP